MQTGKLKAIPPRVTVKGYGGEIEIVVGVDNDGVITGINVGGANFSETAGLGAKTKEPAFTEQFKGLSAPLTLKGNVDSVSGASVSSGRYRKRRKCRTRLRSGSGKMIPSNISD